MTGKGALNVSELLIKREREIMDDWTKAQADIPAFKKGLITEKQLKDDSARFLKVLAGAAAGGNLEDITAPNMMMSTGFWPTSPPPGRPRVFRRQIRQPAFFHSRILFSSFCRTSSATGPVNCSRRPLISPGSWTNWVWLSLRPM